MSQRGGGHCVAVAVLLGPKMTLPSKRSGSKTFIKTSPVLGWQQSLFCLFPGLRGHHDG